MYWINKIVGWCISPTGLTLVGFLLALGLRVIRQRRLSRWAFALSFAWLWVWAMPTTSRFVGAPLEREVLVDGRVPAIDLLPEADAIWLLGGGMGIDERLGGTAQGADGRAEHAEMWTSADRVWMAARLWKMGKAPKIVASGVGVRESTGGLLADFGIPTNAVVYLDSPRNTEEEARQAVKMFSLPKPKILVVTSAWHMKRTLMMFGKYASELEAIPAPADFENLMATAEPWTLIELLPSPQALTSNSIAFHEWLGIVGYGLFR